MAYLHWSVEPWMRYVSALLNPAHYVSNPATRPNHLHPLLFRSAPPRIMWSIGAYSINVFGLVGLTFAQHVAFVLDLPAFVHLLDFI